MPGTIKLNVYFLRIMLTEADRQTNITLPDQRGAQGAPNRAKFFCFHIFPKIAYMGKVPPMENLGSTSASVCSLPVVALYPPHTFRSTSEKMTRLLLTVIASPPVPLAENAQVESASNFFHRILAISLSGGPVIRNILGNILSILTIR